MILSRYIPTHNRFESIFFKLSDLVSAPNIKVGIIDWWWTSAAEARVENLKKFVESQDICFFISEEVFNQHKSIDMNAVFKMLNSHNVCYLIFSKDFTLKEQPCPTKTFYYPWFFKGLGEFYVPTDFIPNLDYVEKPYAFNLMLGSEKWYRTYAYEKLKDNSNIYSTYLGHPEYKHHNLIQLDDTDIQTDLITQDVAQKKLHTTSFVEREGKPYLISHVVPQGVYANTHFDIVTETLVDSQNIFLTEKTAKPLITGRFFCWYNSENIINHLSQYGFDFSDYYAEYDMIPDNIDRLNSMLEVVKSIANDNLLLANIYEKTKIARIHNMETYKKHKENFTDRIETWILTMINN
jgi:uncharacterized CHY-type Zn-finger protein